MRPLKGRKLYLARKLLQEQRALERDRELRIEALEIEAEAERCMEEWRIERKQEQEREEREREEKEREEQEQAALEEEESELEETSESDFDSVKGDADDGDISSSQETKDNSGYYSPPKVQQRKSRSQRGQRKEESCDSDSDSESDSVATTPLTKTKTCTGPHLHLMKDKNMAKAKMAKADIYCSLRNCLRLQIRFANHFCTTTPQLETVEEAMHITNLLFYWMCEQPKIIDELSQRFCECVNDLSSSVTDGTSNDEAAVEEDKEPQADQ